MLVLFGRVWRRFLRLLMILVKFLVQQFQEEFGIVGSQVMCLIDPYIIEKILDNEGKEIYIANPKLACFSCNEIPVIYGEQPKLELLDKSLENTNQSGNTADNTAANSTQNTGDDPDQQPETVPDIPELQIATTQLQDGPQLLAQSLTQNQEKQYAPRVISGELAFLIRSALQSGVYGEAGSSWNGTGWWMARQ